MGTQLPSPKRGQRPQLSAHLYCCQTAGCIKMPLGMEVGLSPGDFMLNGDPAPLPKRRRSPLNFRPMSIVANGWMDQDGTWHVGRPFSSPHCAEWVDSSPPQKGAQFSAHVYCGQTAGCIKMPFVMEVGFSPGDFVLDGDPAPYPKRGGAHPIFGPRLLWPNGCMYVT